MKIQKIKKMKWNNWIINKSNNFVQWFVSTSTNYKLEYKCNKTAENNLLCSMHIKSSGLPPGAVIIINKNNITSNSIKVS